GARPRGPPVSMASTAPPAMAISVPATKQPPPPPPQQAGTLGQVPPQPLGPPQHASRHSGVQPHTLVTPPPPQVWSRTVHVPQSRLLPQPLATAPQFFPSAAQVVGTQPHTFAVPPTPQDWG